MNAISDVVARLRADIPRLMDEHDVPGLAIGIGDRSGPVWSEGFGVKVRGGTEPVTSSTTFSVQSASKMYTATAIMVAVQKGLVDLDEPITTYLPEFTVHSCWEPHPERRITLRHCLSHRAGFTHEAPRGGNFDGLEVDFDEHCRSISDTWLRFPVGSHFEYSNLGIDLAAWAVQRVSRLPFPAFARRVLFDPLGLERTTFDPERIVADPDRAMGHSRYVEHLRVRVPMVAAGGLYASVDDALGYLRLHLADGLGLLDEASLQEMYRIPDALPGQRCGYGLGVEIGRWNGKRIPNHGGRGFGFISDHAWDPETGFGVVVLTNSEDHPLQVELASRVLAELSGGGPAEAEPSEPGSTEPGSTSPTDVTDQDLPDGAIGTYVGRGVTVRVGEERPFRFHFAGRSDTGGPRYLIDADTGAAHYRNDLPTDRVGGTVQTYAVELGGAEIGRLVLTRHEQWATLGGVDGLPLAFPLLRLTEHAPGLYFSAMGEALDLTTDPPTYANIPLRPVDIGTDGERG